MWANRMREKFVAIGSKMQSPTNPVEPVAKFCWNEVEKVIQACTGKGHETQLNESELKQKLYEGKKIVVTGGGGHVAYQPQLHCWGEKGWEECKDPMNLKPGQKIVVS